MYILITDPLLCERLRDSGLSAWAAREAINVLLDTLGIEDNVLVMLHDGTTLSQVETQHERR